MGGLFFGFFLFIPAAPSIFHYLGVNQSHQPNKVKNSNTSNTPKTTSIRKAPSTQNKTRLPPNPQNTCFKQKTRPHGIPILQKQKRGGNKTKSNNNNKKTSPDPLPNPTLPTAPHGSRRLLFPGAPGLAVAHLQALEAFAADLAPGQAHLRRAPRAPVEPQESSCESPEEVEQKIRCPILAL